MANTLRSINKNINSDPQGFIELTEREFDDSLEKAADMILGNSDYDIVMLAGPSSSGKTTTAGKLVEKIHSRGESSFRVSLDDFYLNRDDIPMTENGIRDFENITALDLELIYSTFDDLIKKRVGYLPVFDFASGRRAEKMNKVRLEKNDVMIVEGIHALNPRIAEGLEKDHILKIYISVSTRITEEDGDVLLGKRDLRLIRRMIRDYHHRGSSVEDTLTRWPGVLAGEDKYLFPYRKNADIKINSFHAYEPCLFRDDAIKLLDGIDRESELYPEAQRLSERIGRFDGIPSELLPKSSLLREFMC